MSKEQIRGCKLSLYKLQTLMDSPRPDNKTGVDFTGIFPTEAVERFSRLGKDFGVKVDVLTPAGESFLVGRECMSYSQFVPKGSTRIRLSSARQDIQDFWDAVKQEKD